MRVNVDEDACVSSGECVVAAPAVFDQRDEDAIVVLLDNEPPPELHEATRNASWRCPVLAIRLSES